MAKGKATRDEISTIAPTIKDMWLEASTETLTRFQSLAKSVTQILRHLRRFSLEEKEIYEEKMKEFERLHPEVALKMQWKADRRKQRQRHKKGIKKKSKEKEKTKRPRTGSAAKHKVTSWLDNLSETDLAALSAKVDSDVKVEMKE